MKKHLSHEDFSNRHINVCMVITNCAWTVYEFICVWLLKLFRREEQTRNVNTIAYSFVLWCPLRFPHENNVRFVYSSSCLQRGGGSYLIYFIYACLPMVRSIQHISCCVVVLFTFVLCLCCQFLWLVSFWLPLMYSIRFIDNSISQKTRLQLWQ